MPALFRRHSALRCFFCQSPTAFSIGTRNFKCASCGCWNRYDDKGEIISDEPAMHEEHLNSKSFAKRASHRMDRLPTIYGPGPFCHSCQTNQMLTVNLLSNYLPAPESPDYESRLEMLPAYRESLYLRYPPVCESCLPQVEEEIRNKEQMARVKALGGWLSKGKERQRRVSGPDIEREKATVAPMFWWKIRGCLWALSFVVSITTSLAGLYDYSPFSLLSFLRPILPLLVAVSILWTAWDPTYMAYRKAHIQGRDVRIHGKRTYNSFQMLAWTSRLVSSIITSLRWFRPDLKLLVDPAQRYIYLFTMLVMEIITIIASCLVLRVQQPPAIRLVDTHSHKFTMSRSATPTPSFRSSTPAIAGVSSLPEHDVLASLSLSSMPIIAHNKPVFGVPSLHGSTPAKSGREQPNDDEMDWTPTNPESSSGRRVPESDTSWLRPQRFFAPEEPTGLEGLFQSARIQEEPMQVRQKGSRSNAAFQAVSHHLWKWGPLYTLFVALLVISLTYILQWSGLIKWAI
ncbi:Ima1 N-terminal domain-containing protein [Crassisporium funariophilum]|nr:Ima1 N-terminal domain-containing protein [Crassisporium funariophilum]